MRLIWTEIYKIWMRKAFLGLLGLLLVINVFFLWHESANGTGNVQVGAYKKITEEISGLSEEEKSAWIQQRYETISAMLVIEKILQQENNGVTEFTQALRKENQTLIDTYNETYKQGKYLIYTDNIIDESVLIGQIKSEIEQVESYHEFLESLQEKADNLSQISIFKSKDGDSYNQQCIEKERKAYAKLNDVVVSYVPQKGVMTAIDFRFTDMILLLFMMLLAWMTVSDEKNNGTLKLLAVTPGGKIKTSMAKLCALAVSLCIAVCLLYGTNLLYCAGIYGLGDLSRSVQSLPDMMQSSLHVSVGGYLGLFILVKCMSALIIGLLVALMAVWCKKIVTSFLAVGIVLAVGQLIYQNVSAISKAAVFRYLNFSALADTNDFLGHYQLVRVFDTPVQKIWIETGLAAVSFIVFLILFIVGFNLAAIIRTKPTFILRIKKHRTSVKVHRHLMYFEGYKLGIMTGVLFVSIVFTGLMIYQAIHTKYYVGVQEMYYRKYVQAIEGRLMQEKYNYLQEEIKKFEPLYELEAALDRGEITSEQYDTLASAYGNLSLQKQIFETVVADRVDYLKKHPQASIVYESGYSVLLDLNHQQDTVQMLYLLVFVIISSSGIFAIEKQTGMQCVIGTIALGHERTFARKVQLIAEVTMLYAGASMTVSIVIAEHNYGIAQLGAPLQSIHAFENVYTGIRIWMIIVLQWLARWTCAAVAASVTLWLSWRWGHSVLSIFAGLILICLMPFLSLCGIEQVEWLSTYPIFHIVAILADTSSSGNTGAAWLYWGCAILLIVAVIVDLKYAFIGKQR